MVRQYNVIYVPGILDDIYHVQSSLLQTWRLYGLRPHCHPMPWAGNEAFEPKFQRLLALIDQLDAKGHGVFLVGASAGASAVINAYLERSSQVSAVALICAKINHPETVSQETLARNPAFEASLGLLQTNLAKLTAAEKAKIVSFYSPADGVIPYADTTVPGIVERALPALRHGRAILYGLSFGGRAITAELRRRAE